MRVPGSFWIGIVTSMGLWGIMGSAAPADSYSYPELVEKIYDLEALSVLPPIGERGLQWSSYDRRSDYDAEHSRYIAWDANGDGDSYIREEGGRIVMAEMDGPGCIWRIWAATAGSGKVTLILDGEPAVDLPFEDLFSGTVAPFNRDELVHVVANGKNNYTPIPFQTSCKILADRDYGRYFIIGYSIFPRDTLVPTFSMQLSREENQALDQANAILKHRALKTHAGEQRETTTVVLKPGQVTDVFSKQGAYAVTQFICEPRRFPADPQDQEAVLRGIDLSMNWDGEITASVWSPLGDFFGTGPGLNAYSSYPMGMNRERFYSNWWMPFSNSAAIRLHNQSEHRVELEFQTTYVPLHGEIDRYARFHAKWHRDVFPLADERGGIDWTLLRVEGRGRYVGTQLQIWNPRGGWWGEGDEKFYIDGESFPSLFGTGSEDYIGYAWSSYELFQHPFHNQTLSENGVGHISVNRWHIQDNIPFQSRFHGYIEKYYANQRPTQYAAVVYWYADSHSLDPHQPVSPAERMNYYRDVTYPLACNGVMVMEKPAGMIVEQHMGGFPGARWTEDQQLWWEATRPDTVLQLGFQVPEAGAYDLFTRLTKAIDYGTIRLSVNNAPVGGTYDCYQPDGVGLTDEIHLGRVELPEGMNMLEVDMIGKHPDAYGRYMFGMDYLRVRRAD